MRGPAANATGPSAERDATVYAPLLDDMSSRESTLGVRGGGLTSARKLSGPELSLQLLVDSDTAWRAIGYNTFACLGAHVQHIRPTDKIY